MICANRHLCAAVAAAALLLASSTAAAAGIEALRVPAQGASPAMSGAVWYPCATAPSDLPVGPFVLSVAKDCAVQGSKLPLIVMSHGRGGTFLGNRDTAQALADAGFVVAAISHPGDNAEDKSARDLAAFVSRPSDMRRLVDYLLSDWHAASQIDADRIGLFGFSRGGYTGLVVAGAVPQFPRPAAQPVHDARVKAAVIADPLAVYFTQESLAHVGIPLQLWQTEFGGDGVTPDSVARVAAALPLKPEWHVVKGAGHFAFLPPCPVALQEEARELCADAAGFDRAAFHRRLNEDVVRFFRQKL